MSLSRGMFPRIVGSMIGRCVLVCVCVLAPQGKRRRKGKKRGFICYQKHASVCKWSAREARHDRLIGSVSFNTKG